MANLAQPPWFKDRTGRHPFALAEKLTSNDPNCSSSFYSVAFFPWTADSLYYLWRGDLCTPENLKGWEVMISEFSGTIAVGGDSKIIVWSPREGATPVQVKLPHDECQIRSVAWAISQGSHLEPIVLFSGSKVLYAFNVKKRKIISYLRGHGAAITSITVHPSYPQIFCTTSKDFTSRIYDLTRTPQVIPNNPHWPPGTAPSLAGAAHGLHISEGEGTGIGRCVLVLMGGRSGGHRAAVLGAAFHPVLPLIATCGLDRAVKIWHLRLPRFDKEKLAREDKPLFSSSRVHQARVLSITWMSQDILLTHGAPVLMRKDADQDDDTYFAKGTLVLWQWLGMDRFFPADQKEFQMVLRGCSSDFQESSSFTLMSMLSLPIVHMEHGVTTSPSLHVGQSPYHDPLLLFITPHGDKIRILNAMDLPKRKPPLFPPDKQKGPDAIDENGDNDGDGLYDNALDVVDGWEIGVDDGEESQDTNDSVKLETCAIGLEGRIIIGVGSRETIWVWTDKNARRSEE